MIIGYSTGSLAKGDFKKALYMLSQFPEIRAIELSALRENELPTLVKTFPSLNLEKYDYISVHAPSKLTDITEADAIKLLLKLTSKGIHVIVHPDIITDFNLWLPLGEFLCIENMDKRKFVGRTALDLERLFDLLPEAGFCLDLGHAKQVDPSMAEAMKMLKLFSNRLVQIHISDVTSNSNHIPINIEAILAYRKLESHIPLLKIPFIIESPVVQSYIRKEFNFVNSIFSTNTHSETVVSISKSEYLRTHISH